MAAKKTKKKNTQAAAPVYVRKKSAGKPVLTQSTMPARSLFRLLPATMFMAFLLLTLKVVEIFQEGKNISQALFVETVLAEQEAKSEEKKDKPAEEKTAAKDEHAKDEHGKEDKKEGEGHGEERNIDLPQGASTTPPAPTSKGEGMDVPNEQQGFNKRELAVLENLSARREKINQIEREVMLRQTVLEATEKRIDDKITELKTLNDQLKQLLVIKDKEEEAKIASLVKIYESMKPKDAARIFDELDMNILLMVVDKMSERKVAPVLAAMSPEKAKGVTEQLAAQQKSDKETLNRGQEKAATPPL